jgi:hypothetical protein
MRVFNRLLRYYSTMEKGPITNREECLQLLNELTINYKLYQHDPVFNMEEMSNKLKL